MKIPDRPKTDPASAVGRAAQTASAATDGVGQQDGHRTALPLQDPHSIEDVATLLGIPTTDMTTAIRLGLARLIDDVVRLQKEIEVKDKRIAYLEKLVDEDPLMPVLNRRAFVRELSRSMSYAERYGIISSVLYFDVNGMKRINDTYGHGAGDAALSHVAKTLVTNVRKSDVVGRLGGDEFGVILVQADEDQAKAKGGALATVIADTPFLWETRQLSVSVSFGASSFSKTINTADEALAFADRHMYADKRAKKDQSVR